MKEARACEHAAAAEAAIRSGHIDAGIETATQALDLARESGDAAEIAGCWRVLGMGHQYAGRLKESLLALYRAIELFEQIADTRGLARSLSLAGISQARLGDATEAFGLATRALEVAKPLDDPGTEARIWNNLAVVYEAVDEPGRAVDAFDNALRMALRLGDDHMATHFRANLLMNRLAHHLKPAGDSPEPAARPAIEAALAELLEHARTMRADVPHLLGAQLAAAAEGHRRLGRLDEARRLCTRAQEIADDHGMRADAVRTELTMSEIERAAGHGPQALQHAQRGLEQARSLADPELIVTACLQLSKVEEAQRRYRRALDHFKTHAKLRAALDKAHADTRAQLLAVRMDNERARHEATLLRMRTAELEQGMRQLAGEAEQLDRAAHEDTLTGVGNRRHFARRLQALAGQRPVPPVTLAVLDLDHFKQVNDRHSHAIGDQVLQRIGLLLREHCRPHDVVARFGGEEFVLALVGIEAAQAKAVAQRLRASVERQDWAALAPGLSVTISVGLAIAQTADLADAAAVEAALARADAALYRAKQGGRNRVEVDAGDAVSAGGG